MRSHFDFLKFGTPAKQLRRESSKPVLCVNQVVTPAEAGVQVPFTIRISTHLDSGFHRNDKGVPADSLHSISKS